MGVDRPPADFGSTLREARERRGITLRQIANSTKISVSVLEALERNDISRLPGGIFGRAFVRSFAVEVGLDPEKTIQHFIAQFPHESVTAGHPATRQIDDNEALASDRRTASTFLRLIGASVPLAAAVFYFTSSGGPSPPEAPEAPVSAAAIGRVDVESQEAGAGASAASAQVAADRASPSSAEPAAASLLIDVTATRVCWVSLTVDDDRPLRRLLQAGEGERLEVRRELVLTAGDAAAIAMTINGDRAKPLGQAGQVVTTRITLANFGTYLAAP